jgi:carboxypeptidase A4
MTYMDEVATTYSSIASIIEIGTSLEGRPLRVLKLSNGPGKAGIFFDTVLHAREWIGPPTSLYAINELTENLANNQGSSIPGTPYYLLKKNNLFTLID